MILIIKGTEPKQLTQYRLAKGTYTDLPTGVKKIIKTQLLAEQSNRCAYCTARITERKMKIEHWHPQSVAPPDLSLMYSNMLAVCSGDLYCKEDHHCDTSKGATPIIIDPQKPGHINSISYGKASGLMTTSNKALKADINEANRLNLNCQSLQDRRRDILIQFRNDVHFGTDKKKKKRFTKMLEQRKTMAKPFEDIIYRHLLMQVERYER